MIKYEKQNRLTTVMGIGVKAEEIIQHLTHTKYGRSKKKVLLILFKVKGILTRQVRENLPEM